MKKKLAMSMAAILSLALLASCGGKKAAETTAKAEETSTEGNQGGIREGKCWRKAFHCGDFRGLQEAL